MSLRSPTTPTLPSTIPGLLRLGSPVIYHEAPAVDLGWVGPGVVINLWTLLDWPMADICCRTGAPKTGFHLDRGKPDDSRTIDLDLSDATGRAHAAWWLASQIWRARDHRWRQPIGWFAGVAAWYLVTSGDDSGWASPDRKRGMSVGMEPRTIESLRRLDMADARLLPDGSRWVDAEALRRVCLHVAKETQ